MSAKRVKPAPLQPEEESQSAVSEEAGPSSSGCVRDVLLMQQSLLKSTVQQLHLLPKFNSLLGEAKGNRVREARLATQFNLLLSMRECLQVQQQLANKGRISVSGAQELLDSVEASLAAMSNLELKGNEKTKAGYELAIDKIDGAVSGYFDGLFADTKLTIDQWNAMVMKGISQSGGSVIKSPLDLASEVRETSDKILGLYRPAIGEGLLAKRPDLSEQSVARMYEDSPMTHQILKDLLRTGRAFQAELTEGIQFGNTEKFLRERQQRKSVKKDKPEYADHKDRRIKFDVHEKIVDFMPTVPHPALTENRDHILANLFGKSSGETKQRKASVDEGEYFQDVALI